MAKLCPLTKSICTSECAWRVEDDCAMTIVSKNVEMIANVKNGELFKRLFTLNSVYGSCCINKDIVNGIKHDTDGIRPYDEDKFRREGYKNENT